MKQKTKILGSIQVRTSYQRTLYKLKAPERANKEIYTWPCTDIHMHTHTQSRNTQKNKTPISKN